MSEPRRLLEDHPDDFTTALLRSADRDEPSARSLQRALGAVSAAAAIGTISASSGAASAVHVVAIAKWLGMGALAGTLVAVGAERVLAPAPAVERVERPAVASALPVRPPGPLISAKPLPAPVASEEPPAASAHPIAQDSGSSAPQKSTLAAELAELDRARATLASGDPRAALGAIDRYQVAHPRGRLTQEAELLRIEALVAARDCVRARERGTRFVSDHPNSAFGRRVRSLLDRCGS